jgi:hypothetical protein
MIPGSSGHAANAAECKPIWSQTSLRPGCLNSSAGGRATPAFPHSSSASFLGRHDWHGSGASSCADIHRMVVQVAKRVISGTYRGPRQE